MLGGELLSKRSNGHPMKNKLHHWLDSPSTRQALVWLTSSRLGATPENSIRKARALGLFGWQKPSHYRVDSKTLSSLTIRALKNLPEKPGDLGQILHGLGEIAARSNSSILDIVIDHLERNPRIKWKKVFSSSFAQDKNIRNPVRVDILAFTQWLSTASLNWDSLSTANTYVVYGHEPILCGYYGLTFTARIALAIDARTLDGYWRKPPLDWRIAAIGRAALNIALPLYGKPRADALLKSRNAAIRCIGATALITPPDIFSNTLSLRDCHEVLTKNGIASSDSIWILGIRVKETIHDHYRLQSAQEGESARLQQIERDPTTVYGGSGNYATEAQAIKDRLASLHDRHLQTKTSVDTSLSDIADLWPSSGLNEAQLKWLDQSLIRKTEFRYRLAEKLPDCQNRNALLKRNLSQLSETFGFNPKEKSAQRHLPLHNDREFMEAAEWAAKSMVLLYKDDERGIGRQVGILLQDITTASAALMKQPFIAVRKPELWSTTISSAAYAHRFSLMVSVAAPQTPSSGAITLRGFAINHAFGLLSCNPAPPSTEELFFRLALDAIYRMADLPNSEEIREAWALSEFLPTYIRALALWSSPTLVLKHNFLARTLFVQSGEHPLSRDLLNITITQLVNLLDIAIASAHSIKRDDLIENIVTLWEQAYEKWRPISENWADCAARLKMATLNDGPDRKWLLAGSAFSSSACAALIRSESGDFSLSS